MANKAIYRQCGADMQCTGLAVRVNGLLKGPWSYDAFYLTMYEVSQYNF